MAKKINCKHGLNHKQEIEARRLRVKLDRGDKETLEKYHNFWLEWFKLPNKPFKIFLKERDLVYYSAYIRACQFNEEQKIFTSIVRVSIN